MWKSVLLVFAASCAAFAQPGTPGDGIVDVYWSRTRPGQFRGYLLSVNTDGQDIKSLKIYGNQVVDLHDWGGIGPTQFGVSTVTDPDTGRWMTWSVSYNDLLPPPDTFMQWNITNDLWSQGFNSQGTEVDIAEYFLDFPGAFPFGDVAVELWPQVPGMPGDLQLTSVAHGAPTVIPTVISSGGMELPEPAHVAWILGAAALFRRIAQAPPGRLVSPSQSPRRAAYHRS